MTRKPRNETPLHRSPRENLEGAFDWDPSKPLAEQWPWNGASRPMPISSSAPGVAPGDSALGKCEACGELIGDDEEVHVWGDGIVTHLSCTDDADDPPTTVKIDSDGAGPAVQLDGVSDAPPLFAPAEAEQLASDLLLGADAARQAEQDGYTGPAAVIELQEGTEPEQGVSLEARAVTDDEIRALRASFVEGTATDAIGRHISDIALGGRGHLDRDPTPEEVQDCRARCVDAIARREGCTP